MTKRQRFIELAKGLIWMLAGCLSVVFFRFATGWVEQLSVVCLFRKVTGFYCPGCGTVRALEALALNDFWSAFYYNPFLFVVVIPCMVYLCIVYLVRGIFGKWMLSTFSSPMVAIGGIAGIWVLRNLFPLGLKL